MKTILTVLFFFFIFGNVVLSQSTFQKIYDYTESNQAYNIVALSDGGYAFLSIADESNGTREVMLTKLDCTGNIEWAKKYGISSSLNNVFGGLLEADNGDIVFVYNVGQFQGYNIIVGRIQKDGTPVWKKIYGGGRDDQGLDMVQTSDGNFVVVGKTNTWGTDVSGLLSRTDIYLFKIDGNGEILWTQTYGQQGGTDDAYGVTEDSDGSLLVTGRSFYEGYFRCFLLKTNSIGEQIFNKGFGQFDHTARGFDVIVTSDDKYLITGSTTIAKDNFSSLPDPFLIKTDKNGNVDFIKIYPIAIGDDGSESGSSIVELPNGNYAVGVPTLSFSAHTIGPIPNKNAIYTIAPNGDLAKATIYNQGGSHYSRLHAVRDGGYILSNFTNFYNSSAGEFRPLIIKMDADLNSGCNEIEVTNEVGVADITWEILDLQLTNLEGGQNSNTSNETVFQYDGVTTLCETLPEQPVADFSFQNACQDANILFTDESSSTVIEWNWDFDGMGNSTLQDPEYAFSGSGSFPVQLIVDDGCLKDTVTKDVELQSISFNPFDTTICKGESYVFNGRTFTESVDFVDTLMSSQGCDSVVILTLTVNPCGCEITFPNIFSPDNNGTNDQFGPVVECDLPIKNYRLLIFDRWGETVFDTYDFEKKWDGTLNGIPLPRDVFVYSVQYEIEDGGEVKITSDIKDFTLIR